MTSYFFHQVVLLCGDNRFNSLCNFFFLYHSLNISLFLFSWVLCMHQLWNLSIFFFFLFFFYTCKHSTNTTLQLLHWRNHSIAPASWRVASFLFLAILSMMSRLSHSIPDCSPWPVSALVASTRNWWPPPPPLLSSGRFSSAFICKRNGKEIITEPKPV